MAVNDEDITSSQLLLSKAYSFYDLIDVLCCTVYTFVQVHLTVVSIRLYWTAYRHRLPRSQRIVTAINAVQISWAMATGLAALLHHLAPWYMSCHQHLLLSSIGLMMNGGGIAAVLVAMALQSTRKRQRRRWVLGLGTAAVLATMAVNVQLFTAVSVYITPYYHCSMSVMERHWVLMKLFVDLVTNLGLSAVYLSLLRRMVADTGLPLYQALFTDGIAGRLLVLASNIGCAIVVASQQVPHWAVVLYSLDAMLASVILTRQLVARHRVLVAPLVVSSGAQPVMMHASSPGACTARMDGAASLSACGSSMERRFVTSTSEPVQYYSFISAELPSEEELLARRPQIFRPTSR